MRQGAWFLVVFSCVLAHAHPFFGPSQFTRGRGARDEFTESFSVSINASTFKVIVNNGDSSGANRVSSASVFLNGNQILGPDDFNPHVNKIEVPVSLAPNNELRVRLEGKPGGFLTVSVSAVADSSGGFVTSPAGARLIIPIGALEAETTVSLDDLPLSSISIELPQGYSFLQGVTVDLGGAELSTEAELAIPVGAFVTNNLIVARIFELGTLTRLVLTDTASLDSHGFIHTNSPPLPGVTQGGSYLFLQMPSRVGMFGVDVQNGQGAPVKNALVSAFTTAVQSGATAADVTQAASSQAVFVGQTDATGFAAIPGIAANTTVALVTAAPGASPTTQLFGAGILNAPSVLPVIPSLVDRVKETIVERPPRPDVPPDAIPPCPCAALLVNPHSIPQGTSSAFSPGDTQQLLVTCGGEDVTVSTEVPSGESILDLLLTGSRGHFTLFVSRDPEIATVTHEGLVTAVSPGQTQIAIIGQTARIISIEGAPFTQICNVGGLVSPVVVGAAAPAWAGTVNGSVTLACQGAGTASWNFSIDLRVTSFSGPTTGLCATFGGCKATGTASTKVVGLPATPEDSCQALSNSTSNVPIVFTVFNPGADLSSIQLTISRPNPGDAGLYNFCSDLCYSTSTNVVTLTPTSITTTPPPTVITGKLFGIILVGPNGPDANKDAQEATFTLTKQQ